MHGAAKLSDCGIFLREAVPSLPCEAVEYPHRDDYYLFGVVYGGSCTVCVDFQEYELTGGDVVCVLPGQAHAFLQAENLSASLLGMDALLVGGSDRSVIDEYALAPVPLRVDVRQRHELGALFSLLSDRYAEAGDESSREVVRRLAGAVAAVVMEAVRQAARLRPQPRRYVDIMLRFRKLLQAGLREYRSPARYAAALHISEPYLNEAVRAVTGMSAGKYIRSEIVLEAKRLLCHTDGSVKEIARPCNSQCLFIVSGRGTGIRGLHLFFQTFCADGGHEPCAFSGEVPRIVRTLPRSVHCPHVCAAVTLRKKDERETECIYYGCGIGTAFRSGACDRGETACRRRDAEPRCMACVAGTAERARAETLSGTSEACLCASLGNEKAAENSGFFIIGAQDETRTHTP